MQGLAAAHCCDGISVGNSVGSLAQGVKLQVGEVKSVAMYHDYYALQFVWNNVVYQCNCSYDFKDGDSGCVITLGQSDFGVNYYDANGARTHGEGFSYTTLG
ncbi:MAG: hypothetical protein R3F61_24830 [Myxococcota bacterium]